MCWVNEWIEIHANGQPQGSITMVKFYHQAMNNFSKYKSAVHNKKKIIFSKLISEEIKEQNCKIPIEM